MENTTDKANLLTIAYPPKPGFTLLAYKIMNEIEGRFGLPGVLKDGTDNFLVITQDDVEIYRSEFDSAADVEIRGITGVIGRYRNPLDPAAARESLTEEAEEAGIEDYPDCFCSGE